MDSFENPASLPQQHAPLVLAICTGQTRALLIRNPDNPKEISQEISGIQKSAISTGDSPRPVMCKRLGLEGDEQADLSVHGGLQKAVYCYPFEHYAFWKKELPWLLEKPDLYGQAGENLCVQGLIETQLWIGDELRIGDCLHLRVTKPREPCYKFNARMQSKTASRLMIQHQRSGWYCSVITEGSIKAGDPITVMAGPRDTTVAQELHRLARPQR